MEKSTKGEKLASALVCAGLASLFTGGVATTIGLSVPITVSITVAIILILAYNEEE